MGAKPPALDTLIKAQRALALRLQGKTWSVVAEGSDYSDGSAAYKAVKRLLDNEVIDDLPLYRQEQLMRLYGQLELISPVLERAAAVLSDPSRWEDIKPRELEVHATSFWNGVNSKNRIEDRISKLLGLDKPIRIEADITVTNAKAEAESLITELLGKEADAFSAGVDAARLVETVDV